ncbi:sensor domain-containing diguanylate cyclase [Chitinibacter bivalviorum]|uniref:diguanylate cyclase n=1 Tax=Chitinibacter bivalviorum TaxID=2739434 RepID=A0A7H9BJT6_9NEIS|nr:sensor domain-containing diguanylate cyclase [Chitinibacter bivalviorum]QLG88945.1 sensor domain-containing diguanylate cyclase [Chitinibacter bivalviorum]
MPTTPTVSHEALLAALPVAAWMKDLQSRYIWVNQAMADLMGRSCDELLGQSDLDLLPDWMSEQIQFEELAVLARQEGRNSEIDLPKVGNLNRTVRCYRSCTYSPQGELTGIAGFAVDLTTERQLRKELKAQINSQSSWLRALQDHALITMMDRQGKFTYVSDQFGRLIGQSSKSLIGQLRSNYELQPQGLQINYYLTLAEQGTPVTLEFTGERADGSQYWVRSLLIALNSPAETEQIFFELATDLTTEKQTASALNLVNNNLIELINKNTELIAQLEVAARTDPLTGLLNRRALFERAKQEGDRAKRKKLPLSVIAMDIDHFKVINDSYGHEVGDQALILLARWCGQTLRSSDLMARTGGEEFVVLLPDTDLEHALAIAERIRLLVAQSKVSANQNAILFSYTLSQGVALLGENESIQDALVRADHALYQAKAEGRNRVCVAQSSD